MMYAVEVNWPRDPDSGWSRTSEECDEAILNDLETWFDRDLLTEDRVSITSPLFHYVIFHDPEMYTLFKMRYG